MSRKHHIHLPEWNYVILYLIFALGSLIFLLTAHSSDPVLVPGSWLILLSAVLLTIPKILIPK